MKFCEKLANLRKANNLSQEQLADKLNVSRQSVSKWESGDTYPDMTKIIQMCKILGCTLPELMDDGTFNEDYNKKSEYGENNISVYLKNFLDHVTKTYNMFINMSFKSKLVCVIEMFIVGLLIFALINIFPEIFDKIISKLFRNIPYGRDITDVIVDITTVICAILGFITFFHIFKIRYLDYYIIVEDNTVNEQTIEEPIEENKESSAFDSKPKKSKVVIRDPKHSISKFLDGVYKVLVFFLKLTVILIGLPILLLVIGAVFFAVLFIANISVSTIFTFSFITSVGVILFGLVFVIIIFNFIFKLKQPFKLLLVLFVSSLLLIGSGVGLTVNKALDFKMIDTNEGVELTKTEEYVIEEKYINENLRLNISVEEVDLIIDDTKKDITVIAKMPEYVSLHSEVFHIDDEKSPYLNHIIWFQSNKSVSEYVGDVKNDIKNGVIRKDYDGTYSIVKVKVIMSSKTFDTIKYTK